MAIIVIRNNSKRDITLNIGTESIHIPPYSAVPPVSGLGKVEDSALKEGMKHPAIKGLFDCGDLEIVSKATKEAKPEEEQ